jgi:hypothetical protein
MTSLVFKKKLNDDLIFARRMIERLTDQYTKSSTISGGQLSDRSRVELPHIKHIGNELRYWQGEETRIMGLLDPETSQRAYVPKGALK